MKKSVIVSVVALLSVSFLLGGCGKSPKEEYADLCKKYEPYNHSTLGKKIDKVAKNIKITEEQHKNLDNFKNHVIEGEKIFSSKVSKLSIINMKSANNSFISNYISSCYFIISTVTSVGYGDIYPVTVAGRLVTMVSSFMGIAIVALPAGIITSGYMEELANKKARENKWS